MADFEALIQKHATEDGTVPATAINALVTAIKAAVGNEFVEKTRYKAKLDEIDELKTKQQTAEDTAATAEKWKTKYDALKGDFEAYKTDIVNKQTAAQKQAAYRELLKELNVSDKVADKAAKLADLDSIELGEDGKLKNADSLRDSAKTEWADFIVTSGTQGAAVETPPASGGVLDKTAFEALPLLQQMEYAQNHPVEAAAFLK